MNTKPYQKKHYKSLTLMLVIEPIIRYRVYAHHHSSGGVGNGSGEVQRAEHRETIDRVAAVTGAQDAAKCRAAQLAR